MRAPFVVVALLGIASCLAMPARPGESIDASSDATVDAPTGPYNLAFLTSSTQTAGSLGGSAGGDAICRQRAAEAGFPGTFIAYLSTNATPARARLGNARGWVRPDGRPVADTVDDLVAGRFRYPIRIDDKLVDHDTGISEFVFTGTRPNGAVSSANCNDFVDSLAMVTYGQPDAELSFWTGPQALPCNVVGRLYCLQTDHATPLGPPVRSNAPIAFLSVAPLAIDAAIGIGAADNQCNADAAAAQLPGRYRALLATTGASPVDRFPAGLEWQRVDGVSIGPLGKLITAPLVVLADGAYRDQITVWTGAKDLVSPLSALGTTSSTCADWTSTATGMTGGYGQSFHSTGYWFVFPETGCDAPYHVYCFQHTGP